MIAFKFLEAFAELRRLVARASPIAPTASLVISEFLLLLQNLRAIICCLQSCSKSITSHLIHILSFCSLGCSHVSKNL
jgi:hypothetical protein